MNIDKRTTLIINDYLLEFDDYQLRSTYSQLYDDLITDQRIARLFSIIHQKLDELFRFMNNKSKTNHYYNANESRELLRLIEIIDGLQLTLKTTSYNFIIQKD